MGKGNLSLSKPRSLRLSILFVVIAGLTAADVLTTNRIISMGLGSEGNGVVSILMEAFGSWWWAPKALAAVAFAVIVDGMWERKSAKIAFGAVVAYYAVISARHLLILDVANEIKRLCG